MAAPLLNMSVGPLLILGSTDGNDQANISSQSRWERRVPGDKIQQSGVPKSMVNPVKREVYVSYLEKYNGKTSTVDELLSASVFLSQDHIP
ncbi:hypothetical protein SLE2022_253660 [Rubroshorea leprosula]